MKQDQAAIQELIATEGRGAKARDVALLESVWADDAVVRDANHTPDDLSDDLVWEGWDAILLRYETVIFYLTLEAPGPVDLVMEVQSDTAIVTGTTRIGNERSSEGERWTFRRHKGTWKITGIVFNLEPAEP
ncbi:MAG: hypothetical protein JXA89_00425 [Anaerolineae bacterium]|nr:hypothetical protein [Anaerolineae bacterium]